MKSMNTLNKRLPDVNPIGKLNIANNNNSMRFGRVEHVFKSYATILVVFLASMRPYVCVRARLYISI